MASEQESVWSRISNSAEWLRWLCETIYRHQGILAEKPGWLLGKNVCLVDGSEEVTKGKKKEYFMLHYCLDLFTLAMREMRLTGLKTGEKLRDFTVFGKGDIVLADRIYGSIPGMEYLRELGSDFVLRLRAGAFSIYDGEGRGVDLTGSLSDLQEGESKDIAVYYLSWRQECPRSHLRDTEGCGERTGRARTDNQKETKETRGKSAGRIGKGVQQIHHRGHLGWAGGFSGTGVGIIPDEMGDRSFVQTA
jgi:hypothetical protein